MRGIIGGIVIGLVVGVVLGVTGPKGTVQDVDSSVSSPKSGNGVPGQPVAWRMASLFPGDMALSGDVSRTIAETVTSLSSENVTLSYHAPGSLIEGLDVFDAVSSGTVEAAFSSPSFWGKKSLAFELLGGIPFGPTADEFLAWYFAGGGAKQAQTLYNRHNIHGIICGIAGPVTGGLFQAPVTSVQDLKGKDVAAMGLGARILNRAGARAVLIPPQDVATEMASGKLFGSTFTSPLDFAPNRRTDDRKHIYFPGWSQQFSTFDLLIHLRDWNGLHATAKGLVEAACAQNIVKSLSRSEGAQFAHLKSHITNGAEVQRWPVELVNNLQEIWKKEAGRLSANDRDFRRLWQSIESFRKDYEIWRELGYL